MVTGHGIQPVTTSMTVKASSSYLARCATSTNFATGTVTVSNPVNAITPTVSISGATTADGCSPVTLLATASNLAGVAGVYSWAATGNLLAAVSSTTSFSVVIPGASFTSGTTYTISTVTNYLGVTSVLPPPGPLSPRPCRCRHW